MQTYNEWSPTPFDSRGAFIGVDRGEWLVVPVIQTRDSEPLEESNFAAALEILGGEDHFVEVHRFGHWGPGWIEIIIVHPYAQLSDRRYVTFANLAEEIERRLADYPVLDEEDLCERESEAAGESWNCWGRRELESKVEECLEIQWLDIDSDALDEIAGFPEYEAHSDGTYFTNLDEMAERVTLPSLLLAGADFEFA
ncbi:MAG: hypothetical protein GY737_00045 [Desulfobacteraceae bacterium]|nr:hypothetical protein [Desulfobacteraceae bacterium]